MYSTSWNFFRSNAQIDMYSVCTANSLVTRMIPECKSGEGLLGALLAEGLDHRDVVRTVADLFLAAGDTVSCGQFWIEHILLIYKLDKVIGQFFSQNTTYILFLLTLATFFWIESIHHRTAIQD